MGSAARKALLEIAKRNHQEEMEKRKKAQQKEKEELEQLRKEKGKN